MFTVGVELEDLAKRLREHPERTTPQIAARREKSAKKVRDGLKEWRGKQIWETVAELRRQILNRAKSYNWSVEAADAAEKAKESGGSESEPVSFAGQGPNGEKEHPPVPRTAEEMRRMGVSGAEALKAALAERQKR